MIKVYRKGADFEREIVNLHKAQDMIAFRSAGSHSPIDVCVINHKDKEIKLIQAKNGDSFKDSFKNKLKEQYKFIEGTYKVVFEVWDKEVYEDRKS